MGEIGRLQSARASWFQSRLARASSPELPNPLRRPAGVTVHVDTWVTTADKSRVTVKVAAIAGRLATTDAVLVSKVIAGVSATTTTGVAVPAWVAGEVTVTTGDAVTSGVATTCPETPETGPSAPIRIAAPNRTRRHPGTTCGWNGTSRAPLSLSEPDPVWREA